MKQYSIPPISKKRPTHTHAFPGMGALSALTKTVIVDALGFILSWRPRLAMSLGKLIWYLLPWLKEV